VAKLGLVRLSKNFMATDSQHRALKVSGRFRLMRKFLWIAVLGWGIGLGAKLFDLLVLAGAWSAAPPASLALLPYGSRFPMNPGDFFQPLSVAMVVGIVGALISGWKTRIGAYGHHLSDPLIVCFEKRIDNKSRNAC
jgi:hypothetical protein